MNHGKTDGWNPIEGVYITAVPCFYIAVRNNCVLLSFGACPCGFVSLLFHELDTVCLLSSLSCPEIPVQELSYIQ